MEADGICLRRRQKNRAAEKRQPLILQVFIERLTRRTINDRAVVIADLLASLLELLKLPAGINMLILELPGDDLILIDDTLLHNSDIPLHELYLLMLIVQRSVHVASVNQRLQKHPFLRLLYLYDAFKLLLEFFQLLNKRISCQQRLLKHLKLGIDHGISLLVIFLKHLVNLLKQREYALTTPPLDHFLCPFACASISSLVIWLICVNASRRSAIIGIIFFSSTACSASLLRFAFAADLWKKS